MSDEIDTPFLGPAEQSLFVIENARERADQLLTHLTSKIVSILDWTRQEIQEAYGDNSLDPYRILVTPAHRKKAKETKTYKEASAGLAVKKQGDKHYSWYFQQRLECSQTSVRAILFGHRGREVNPIVTVLQRHKDEAARLLQYRGCFLWQAGLYEDGDESEDQFDPHLSINRLRTGSERDWKVGLSIEGSDISLPLSDENSSWPIVYDFVALFPIFRAATDIRLGHDDQFLTYVRQFWTWDETLEDDADAPPMGGWEGDLKIALRCHRTRERRLRERKIQTALRLEAGRLRCEVPGCGFDFYHVYGEIGRRFAHVHHKNLLSGYTGPMKTRLTDLAIVCANCHAMIHRGNECRPLEGLIPGHP